MPEETRAAALKEVLAWQVQKAMKEKKINQVEMARRMKTSRAALDRLLDLGYALGHTPNVMQGGPADRTHFQIEL